MGASPKCSGAREPEGAGCDAQRGQQRARQSCGNGWESPACKSSHPARGPWWPVQPPARPCPGRDAPLAIYRNPSSLSGFKTSRPCCPRPLRGIQTTSSCPCHLGHPAPATLPRDALSGPQGRVAPRPQGSIAVVTTWQPVSSWDSFSRTQAGSATRCPGRHLAGNKPPCPVARACRTSQLWREGTRGPVLTAGCKTPLQRPCGDLTAELAPSCGSRWDRSQVPPCDSSEGSIRAQAPGLGAARQGTFFSFSFLCIRD